MLSYPSYTLRKYKTNSANWIASLEVADSPVLQFSTPTTWRNGLVGKSWSSAKGIMKSYISRVMIPTHAGWGSLAGKQLCRKGRGIWVENKLTTSQQRGPVAKISCCLLGYRRLPTSWGRWSLPSAESWWEAFGVVHPVWALSSGEMWMHWSESSESPWRSLHGTPVIEEWLRELKEIRL